MKILFIISLVFVSFLVVGCSTTAPTPIATATQIEFSPSAKAKTALVKRLNDLASANSLMVSVQNLDNPKYKENYRIKSASTSNKLEDELEGSIILRTENGKKLSFQPLFTEKGEVRALLTKASFIGDGIKIEVLMSVSEDVDFFSAYGTRFNIRLDISQLVRRK